MKKISVLLCVLALGLTGCQNTGDDNYSVTTDSPSETQSTSLNPDSLADQVDSYLGSGGGEVPADTQSTQQTGETEQDTTVPEDAGEFETKDDTVYATTNVVVRNQPSTTGDPVMNLQQGGSVHRVGYRADWTKVEMNGYFYYIATQYLSETP